jgi:hypothetical protein
MTAPVGSAGGRFDVGAPVGSAGFLRSQAPGRKPGRMFASEGQFSVVLVAAALLAALLVLRWLTRSSASRLGRTIPLTPGHRLHVVEVDGRRLLVGTGPAGAPQLLTELGDRAAWAMGTVWEADGR